MIFTLITNNVCLQLSIDSPVSPVTSIAPLAFVVSVTAIKQAYEDYLRHKADLQVNNRPVRVLRDGQLHKIPAKHIKVSLDEKPLKLASMFYKLLLI